MPSQTFSKAHVIVALILLLFFLYIANPASYYFLNDDFIHIPLAAQKNFFHSSLVRPLADFTLWLDHALWQKAAYGYHLTNVIIHLLNSVLVFFTAKALFTQFGEEKERIFSKAFAAALLFFVYAYHSESLFWIIGRGGSLTTLFFLPALLFYLKSPTNRFYYFLSLCFFLLGLLVYESIWVFPLVVSVIYGFRPDRKPIYIVGAWLFFGLYLLGRYWLAPALDNYELGALNTLDFYKLFYNTNTLFARCFLPPMQRSSLFFSAYVLLLVLLAVAFFKLKSKRFFCLLLCLVVSLVPVVPLGIDTHDSESERFIYLPSFFAVLILVEAFFAFKAKLALYAGFAFLAIHVFGLFKAAETYKTGSAVAKQSLACVGQNNHFKTVYAINLPAQYHGALIFRKGFDEAISWISNSRFDSLVIVSRAEITAGNTLVCSNTFSDTTVVALKQKQTLFDTYSIQPKAGDAVFFWNKNRLEIIR